MINLDRYPLVELDPAEKSDEYIRLYQIERIVYDVDENANDKLISVYSAFFNIQAAGLLVIKSTRNALGFYIGVRSVDNTSTAEAILEKSFKGNFAGSQIQAIPQEEVQKVLGSINKSGRFGTRQNVSSVSIVPSTRDEDKERFVQGIEKFIDTMKGSEYTAVFIAEPLDKEILEQRKRGLQKIYSGLSPFASTQSEKEDLELVCQASPMCTVTLPQVCDVGRTVELDVHIFPADSDVALRVVTDSSDIVDVDGCILYPRAAGTAEIAVYIGDDPYPVATEVIKVRQRNLITDISLFPSALYMPVGGTSELTLTIVPESAENKDEIRWSCDDHSVANVDFSSGVITAIDCGRCCITAYTQEVSKTITLEVQPEIEDIICPCSFLELGVGEQKEWKYQLIPENAYGKDFLRAVSSDRNVAEYRGGYVLGKGLGECKIYIKNQSGSVSRELKVSVKKSKKFW